MLKLVAESITKTIQKIKKKPRAIVATIVGVTVLMAATISSVGFREENRKKERNFAASATGLTLELSKAIDEFYDSDNTQNNLTRSKSNFLEITSQLNNLSNAKAGSQFISTVKKTSEFFTNYCDYQIDILYKTKAMEISKHFDTDQVEKILRDKEKYRSQAKQWQEKIIDLTPKAFIEWKKVFYLNDYEEICDYIDEEFAEQKKKFAEQKEKKNELKVTLDEVILMQIYAEASEQWNKMMDDLISELDAQNKGDAE